MELNSGEWTCGCCDRHKWVPTWRRGSMIWQHSNRDPHGPIVSKDDDFCAAKNSGKRHPWIRVALPVPLAFLTSEVFAYGMWSTLISANVQRYREAFTDDDRRRLGEMSGHVGNRQPAYPDTENLHLTVAPRDDRQRPMVWLQDRHDGHPLRRDPREGVGDERLAALVSRIVPYIGRD